MSNSLLCPFCSAPYTNKMLQFFNDSYVCETGCPYYRIEIKCSSCGRAVYVKGAFGQADTLEEERNYLDEVDDAELIEAIATQAERHKK